MKVLDVVRRDGSQHQILYDAADAAMIERHTWHVQESNGSDRLFYARTNLRWPGGGHVVAYMHTMLVGVRGVDHENHNGLDNRRCNLRPADHSQNGGNYRPQRGVSSQFKGVCWYAAGSLWEAYICAGGSKRYLGRYPSEQEAAQMYDRAARAEWGEYACLNFTDGGS